MSRRCCGRGKRRRRPDVPLTLIVTRSDGMEYRRSVVPDQGIGGRSLDVPIISSAPTGTWRVAAFTDPKRPAIGEATFLVEDYVADRLEFDLTTDAKSISATRRQRSRSTGASSMARRLPA